MLFTAVAVAVVVVIVRIARQLRQRWLGDRPRRAARRGRSATSSTGCCGLPGPVRPRRGLHLGPALRGLQPAPTSAIVCSAILMVVLSLLGVEFGGERVRSTCPRPTTQPVAATLTRRRAPTGGRGLMGELRSLPVPDGLEGERLDAALARLFGLSRTKAAELARRGGDASTARRREVRPGGRRQLARGRAARTAVAEPTVDPSPSRAWRSSYDDDDVVVVDKPVGVAAHPVPGWTGPDGDRRASPAAGYRISTSGAAERQGVVHRLDVGTTGLMVVAKSERAYTSLKRAVQGAHGRQALPRARAGPPGPDERHRSTRRSTGTPRRLQVGRRQPGASRQRHPLRDHRGVPARVAARRSTWRPGAPTRSACTCPRCGTRASAT